MMGRSLVRRVAIRAFLFVFAFGVPAASAIDIQEVVSPGGIKAWLVEEHTVPLIAVEFEFRGGASTDPVGKEGLAYLVAGLMNEGAGEMNALAFQTALEEHAIRMNFDSNRDDFSGSMKTLRTEADEAFRLLGLALNEPRFDEDAVERVREQIYSIQRYEAEQPRTVAVRAWMADAFDGHAYGRNPKGTPGSVARLSRQDLRTYATTNFTRDNMIVAVVGDTTPEELGPLLDSTFGHLPETSAGPDVEAASLSDEAGVTVVHKPVPQSVAVFGMPGIKRDDPDWYAAVVMNYVLGSGSFSSRLMEEVRRKRGLTYGVYTYLLPMDHAGLVMGSVATVNDRMAESMEVITAEIERMAEDGITDKELQDAKTYLIGSYPLSFDTSDAIAGQLVGVQRYGLGMDYIDNRNSLIEAITTEDVKRVAERLLDTDKLFWVIVGQSVGIETSGEESATP